MTNQANSLARSSNTRTSVWLGSAAVAVWLCAWTPLSSDATASKQAPADDDDAAEVAATRAEPVAATAPPTPDRAAPAAASRATVAPAQPEAAAVLAPNEPPRPERGRPDALTEEEQQARVEEHATLSERFDRQEPNPQAVAPLQAAIEERLVDRSLPAGALAALECRRTLCRFELTSHGTSGLSPLEEVHALIDTVRALGETWLRATEVGPDQWRVEAFAPTENHFLTGPGTE
jgi:hypothetical protein